MSNKIIDLAKASPGNFRVRPKWYEGIWLLFEFFIITNPFQVSSKLKVYVLRMFGAKIGSRVIMRSRTRIRFPWNLKIGENCWIGEGVWISNKGMVEIGDNVAISQDTFITTGSHEMCNTMDTTVKPIIIRDGTWITSRCIILQGVEIGVNTVVAPGSVVNKSLEGNSIYGGNPAKFIKKRFEEEEINEEKKESNVCY